MNFVLGQSDAYWWPVTVRRPDPDAPGKLMEQTLQLLLLPQDQDEAIEEHERINAIHSARTRTKAERAALASRILGWRDVDGADGKPVPFTPETLDEALRMSWFRIGVWTAMNQSALGEEARTGN
ncbi:hypothetical protein [Ruixingdingia sedimenti]|uniref:Uncharacterized protein n=1 Tax=Ruixingdingia sedimenti TaxID=3073604 RepID=A0ABU1FEX1_9RHOB|nr:hypothetical protein [Xinfangfangia sp. LG-4]MDR5655409.1 hypothetical protein [Xinfangfangia sp. LG-4]